MRRTLMIASSGGPSGFYHAPVSKALFLGAIVSTLATSILGLRSPILRSVAFASSSEALFGSLLLYSLRVLERLFGSRRFASVLIVSAVLSYLLRRVVVGGGGDSALLVSVLFALVHSYAAVVPATLKVRVLGVALTDKASVAALALSLVCMRAATATPATSAASAASARGATLLPALIRWQPPPLVLSALFGTAAGVLARADSLPFRDWRVPQPVARACARVLMPVLASRNPAVLQQRSRSSASGTVTPAVAAVHDAAAAVPVDEDAVGTLVAMGFARDAVVDALRRNGGSVERAAAFLCR
ncbi:hypothetical protein HDU82_000269 [Entophlyctis luteolus]|nr:hypothetical protein HDU82_000269 [Entophlyctis luteolus]